MPGSRRRTCVDGRTEDGGAVWRRGGIDDRPGKDLCFDLHAGFGLAEDGGHNFPESVHRALSLSWRGSRRWMWPGISPRFPCRFLVVVFSLCGGFRLYVCRCKALCQFVLNK